MNKQLSNPEILGVLRRWEDPECGKAKKYIPRQNSQTSKGRWGLRGRRKTQTGETEAGCSLGEGQFEWQGTSVKLERSTIS